MTKSFDLSLSYRIGGLGTVPSHPKQGRTHHPCTQGQILPVPEIVKLAKSKNIFSIIDGAHGAGMLPLSLHELGTYLKIIDLFWIFGLWPD